MCRIPGKNTTTGMCFAICLCQQGLHLALPPLMLEAPLPHPKQIGPVGSAHGCRFVFFTTPVLPYLQSDSPYQARETGCACLSHSVVLVSFGVPAEL